MSRYISPQLSEVQWWSVAVIQAVSNLERNNVSNILKVN
jgi:hypothetical protein